MTLKSISARTVSSERAGRCGWTFLICTNERKRELLGHLCLKRFISIFTLCFETLREINIERRWFLKVPNPNTSVQDSWRSKCVISSICCLPRAWPYSAAGEKQAWQGSPIWLWRCQDVDVSDRAVWTCWQPCTGINWQQIMLQERPFISCQKTNAKRGP